MDHIVTQPVNASEDAEDAKIDEVLEYDEQNTKREENNKLIAGQLEEIYGKENVDGLDESVNETEESSTSLKYDV